MSIIRLNSKRKGLHGWYAGRRECTAERLLANPYNGCSHDCLACYALALPGDGFRSFRLEGTVTAWSQFPDVVAKELDSLNFAPPLYLSPVSDPLQDVEKELGLTYRTMQAALDRGLPVDLVSKTAPETRILDELARNPLSILQISMPTADEDLRCRLMQSGSTVSDLANALKQACERGIYTVLRLDPIYPFITDTEENISAAIELAADAGVKHIITSVLDIPCMTKPQITRRLEEGWGAEIVRKWQRLYNTRLGSYLHSDEGYRREVFSLVRDWATKMGLTYALCMEYSIGDDGQVMGLNREYATSVNCSGLDIPIHRRGDDGFAPAASCNGACLSCEDAVCGIEELAMGRNGVPVGGIGMKEWRRWSREGKQDGLFRNR